MADDFIVYNPGVAAVFLANLGVEIPPTEDVNLLNTHELEVIQTDAELSGHLSAGTLRRRVGGQLLPVGSADVEDGPVETALNALVTPYQLVISTPGQTVLPLSSPLPADTDSIMLLVNGSEQTIVVDFDYTAPNIIWKDRQFILEPSDEVFVSYLAAV